MSAYLNALREEASRKDLLVQVERLYDEKRALQTQVDRFPIGPWTPIPADMTNFTDKQVLVRGPSGYIKPNHIHMETAHWDHDRMAWYSDSNDRLDEGWPNAMTHYAEILVPKL